MSGPLPRLPFTKALRDALELDTTRPCGLGKVPAGALPYTVLYPVAGSTYDGPPLLDDHADAQWYYQVTSVADAPDQIEWMRDRVRRTILDRLPAGGYRVPIVVTGMVEVRRAPADDSGSGDEEGRMVSAADRFTFAVTPGATA